MIIVDNIDNNLIPIIATKAFMPKDAYEIGYFMEDGYILPFYTKRKFFISYMRFVTGVIGAENSNKEKRFLNNVIKYIRDNKKIDMIIAPHTSAVFLSVPDGAEYCKFGSYIVDLTLDKDTLFNNLHSKHRNVIRKAINDGVKISNAEKYKCSCIDLVNQTAKRQNLHIISKVDSLSMKNNPNIEFYVAIKDDEVIGAAILGWSKYCAYYLYGGSSEHTYPGSMNYLHWQAMLDMKNRGVKMYDFVGARENPKKGSKQEGIQRFKSRFGGTFKLGFIWRYNFNIYKFYIYKMYLKYLGLKNKTYTKDIIDQENE